MPRRKINQGEVARKVFESPAAKGSKAWRLQEVRYRGDGHHVINFGHIYMPEIFHKPSPKFHSKLVADQTKSDRVACAAARKHAKSTITTLTNPLYKICTYKTGVGQHYERPPFIVIVMASQEMATDALMEIKSQIEENELIRQDFGDLMGGSGKWTQRTLDLANGCRVVAIGIESSRRGIKKGAMLPTDIIGDDIDTDESAYSPSESKKIIKKWKSSISLFGGANDCQIYIVGTPITKITLIWDCLQNERYHHSIYQAAQELDIDENGNRIVERALWPEYWTEEKLQELLRELGWSIFRAEMQCDPRNDDEQSFTDEAVNRAKYNWQIDAKLPGRGAADLAIKKTKTAHYFVMLMARRDADGVLWVDDGRRGKFGFYEQIENIFEFCGLHRLMVFRTEEVAYQEALKETLTREGRKGKIKTAFGGIKTDGVNKVQRILRLVVLIENGTIRISERLSWLIEALKDWAGEDNDAVDCLEMLHRTWYPREKGKRVFTGIRPIGGDVMKSGLNDGRKLTFGKVA